MLGHGYHETQVSFQWKNRDFLLKNPDFLLKNLDFFLYETGTDRQHMASVGIQAVPFTM